jgi:hypothetical protein
VVCCGHYLGGLLCGLFGWIFPAKCFRLCKANPPGCTNHSPVRFIIREAVLGKFVMCCDLHRDIIAIYQSGGIRDVVASDTTTLVVLSPRYVWFFSQYEMICSRCISDLIICTLSLYFVLILFLSFFRLLMFCSRYLTVFFSLSFCLFLIID